MEMEKIIIGLKQIFEEHKNQPEVYLNHSLEEFLDENSSYQTGFDKGYKDAEEFYQSGIADAIHTLQMM